MQIYDAFVLPPNPIDWQTPLTDHGTLLIESRYSQNSSQPQPLSF